MKRILFAIGLLTIGLSALAQAQVLTHVDKAGKVYVGKGALFYNGGGLQLKDTGNWENHGDVMLVGTSTDVFKTLDASGNNRVYTTGSGYNAGGVFENKLNTPANYALPNNSLLPDQYTYGQLYVQGLTQANVQGVVNQEHANVNHGTYQQVAMPFFGKELKSLSSGTELNKTFTDQRWSMNEILKYNNANVVFDGAPIATLTSDPSAYYILGNKNTSVNFNNVKTIVGRPYANNSTSVTLQNAGNGIVWGAGGNNINAYNEKYNTYVQDGFELQAAIGGTAWQGNYGRNLYQFGNPYMTNLDLKGLFVSGDPNYIPNIYGIRLEQSEGTVSYSPSVGGGSGLFKFVTWSGSSLVGDSDWAVIRPMSVFSIKLKNNNAGSSINFDNLRRFGYLPRTASTYDVTASRTNNPGTTKELAVTALDEFGKEIGRTYYVVTPNAVTGHSSNTTMQVAAANTNVIGTFEEDPVNGGYDLNYTSAYWLYINEANELNFTGKAIPMALYGSLVKSLRFWVKEEGQYIPMGSSLLSTGLAFYYKLENGTAQQITQGQTIPVTVNPTIGSDVSLYYGAPTSSLAVNDADVKHSRTKVIYNPEIDNFIVRFDPSWKTADVKVYDMSGKLVITSNKVNANKDFVIELARGNKAYVVSVISESGVKVNAKIIR